MNRKHNGYVLVPVENITDHCIRTLRAIRRSRVQKRREYVDKYMISADWWWSHLWRWFGFSKPIKRDALNDFKNTPVFGAGKFTAACEVNLYCAEQESECEKLLTAAKANLLPTMIVSSEALRYCNYR